MKTLLLATRNNGKLIELRAMLGSLKFDLVSLGSFPDVAEVAETGATFAENAALKASEYAKSAGLMTLADDSGLAVDALGGRPGVLSARYGGSDLPFARKMELLLSEIDATGSSDRTARFVCSLAVADPDDGILFQTDGVCEGRINVEPRGSGGFGYDPIFVPVGYRETFGELSSEIKAEISHRAAAFRQLIPFLLDFNAV